VFLGWPALELTKGLASGLERQLAEEVGPIADDIQERSLDIMVAMEDLESERVELLDMGPDPERGRGSGTGDWNRQEQRLVEITNELKEQQELLDIETDVAANARQRARGKPHSVFVVDKLTPGEARWFETMNRADLEDMAEHGITRLDDGSIHVADMDRAFQYIDDVVMSHMSDPADVRPPPSFWKNTFLNKAVKTTVPGRPPIPSLTASPEGRGAMEAALINMEAPSPFKGVSQADFALADEILRQSMGDDAYRAFKDVSRQTRELRMHAGLSSGDLAQELEQLAKDLLESHEAEVRVQQLEGARFMPGDAAKQTIEALKAERIGIGYRSVGNLAQSFRQQVFDTWPGGRDLMSEELVKRIEQEVDEIQKRVDWAVEKSYTNDPAAKKAISEAIERFGSLQTHVARQHATAAGDAAVAKAGMRLDDPDLRWTGEGEAVRVPDKKISEHKQGYRYRANRGFPHSVAVEGPDGKMLGFMSVEDLPGDYKRVGDIPGLMEPGGVWEPVAAKKVLTTVEVLGSEVNIGFRDLDAKMEALQAKLKMHDPFSNAAELIESEIEMVHVEMSGRIQKQRAYKFLKNPLSLVQMAQEALEAGTLRDAGGASAEQIIDAWERAQALPAVEPPAPRLPAPEAPAPSGAMAPSFTGEYKVFIEPLEGFADHIEIHDQNQKLIYRGTSRADGVRAIQAHVKEAGHSDWYADYYGDPVDRPGEPTGRWTRSSMGTFPSARAEQPTAAPEAPRLPAPEAPAPIAPAERNLVQMTLNELDESTRRMIWEDANTVFGEHGLLDREQMIKKIQEGAKRAGVPEERIAQVIDGVIDSYKPAVERVRLGRPKHVIPRLPPPIAPKTSLTKPVLRSVASAFPTAVKWTPLDLLVETTGFKLPTGMTPPLMRTAGEPYDVYQERTIEREAGAKARFAEEEYWRTHTVDLNQMSPAERIRYDAWQKREAETEELLQQYLFNPDLGPDSPRPGYLPYLDED